MIALENVRKAASAFGARCALLALAVFSSAAWAQAGYVHEVSGLVSIQGAATKAVADKAGDRFEADTVFRTGTDGKAILKFADGQVVALGADSALRVGQYNYVLGSLRQSSSTVELMQGGMRFVTGIIGAANREGVRIIAGNTMIGVLSPAGADFTVVVNPGPQEAGYTVVKLGEISARTPYGQISKIAAGQYAPWQPGRTPPLALPFAAAPAVIQARVAALWATALPANTPVAVASAARAAVAVAAATQARAAANADPRLAGYVEAISNTVSIQTNSGRTATANAGTTFEPGTTFNTGTDGRVVLKFADGEVVVLGPGSVLAVAQYQFDPGNANASRSAMELVNGAMRVITGYMHTANHEGISISAGTSIIDILNTGPADFTVAVDTKGQEVGVARVTVGEISVHTPYGPIDKINTDQSSLWGPSRTPAGLTSLASPIPVATGLAVVQAAEALQLSALPDNTPVAVAPAARAAAAVAEANRAQAAASADPENARLRAAAQAAAALANSAAQAATAAGETVAAKVIATTPEAMPSAAAVPAPGQVSAAASEVPTAPTIPAVTPGAGGGRCAGSVC